MHYLRYVYTWIGKHSWLVSFAFYQKWNERLLNITSSHVHPKCGSISETVHVGVVVSIGGDSLYNSGNSDDLEWPSKSMRHSVMKCRQLIAATTTGWHITNKRAWLWSRDCFWHVEKFGEYDGSVDCLQCLVGHAVTAQHVDDVQW